MRNSSGAHTKEKTHTEAPAATRFFLSFALNYVRLHIPDSHARCLNCYYLMRSSRRDCKTTAHTHTHSRREKRVRALAENGKFIEPAAEGRRRTQTFYERNSCSCVRIVAFFATEWWHHLFCTGKSLHGKILVLQSERFIFLFCVCAYILVFRKLKQ